MKKYHFLLLQLLLFFLLPLENSQAALNLSGRIGPTYERLKKTLEGFGFFRPKCEPEAELKVEVTDTDWILINDAIEKSAEILYYQRKIDNIKQLLKKNKQKLEDNKRLALTIASAEGIKEGHLATYNHDIEMLNEKGIGFNKKVFDRLVNNRLKIMNQPPNGMKQGHLDSIKKYSSSLIIHTKPN